MGDYSYSFEKLDVWQESRKLVKIVYKLISKFPDVERFGLCNQIRRAVISIPSNIAEGSGKKSNKEQVHFLEIAYGSLMEVYCQIILSKDLEFLSEEQFRIVKQQIDIVAKLLSGLKNYKETH